MAIQFTTSVEGDTLVVQTTGFDESAEQVQAYGLAVIDASLKHGVSCVLCDERALEYRLGTLDTYACAQFIAERAPRIARIAIVCGAQDLEDAAFWETVAVNRGLTVRAFKSLPEARRWLHAARGPGGV